jgi:signal transduction histidine kinase
MIHSSTSEPSLPPCGPDDVPGDAPPSEQGSMSEVAHLRASVRALEQERTRLSRDLELARAETRRAEQRVEGVLATVSHELRTPLQALHICIELLHARIRGSADEVPQSWILGRLEKAKGSTTRMTKLVRTLLDASLIQAGRLELRPEPLDLRALCADVVGAMREELAWAGCPCSFGDTNPVMGRWDRTLLELVVANLLSNAMKYGAGRPVHVEVEGFERSARITVKDNGVGIAAEDQARIFDRFERVHTTTHLAGFGLGLWIVRHVIEAMDGTISVKSRPGEGATFVIVLPRDSYGPSSA